MIDPRLYKDFKEFVAGYEIVVKGKLDAEYKRVTDLIAEWDKRNNLAKIQSDVQQGQAALANAQLAFKQEQEKAAAKLKAAEDLLAKKEAELATKVKLHNQEKDALGAAQGLHATTSAATKATLDAREKVVAQKERDLDNLQAVLHQRDVKLAEREAKVNQVLSQLKATVA